MKSESDGTIKNLQPVVIPLGIPALFYEEYHPGDFWYTNAEEDLEQYQFMYPPMK